MRLAVVPLMLLGANLWAQAQATSQNPSAQKEAALGAQLAADLERRTTPLGVAGTENYLASVGGEIAAQTPNAAEQHWRFRAITDYDSAIEPISLPDGWIFVPAHLFLDAQDEDEFVGILAHAMAHVAARQFSRQASGETSQPESMPIIFLSSPENPANILLPASYVKRQQQYELEADAIAVKAMTGSGFNPEGLIDYIARIQSQPSIRLSTLRQVVQGLPVTTSRRPNTAFLEIRSSVRSEVTAASIASKRHPAPSLLHPER